MVTRNLGYKISNNEIKKLKEDDANKLFSSPNLIAMARNSISTIEYLKTVIKRIEKTVASKVSMRKEFEMLLTMPGIGLILGLTIMLEVGEIGRFHTVGDYSSYSRCVDSKRSSNGKKKGENNKKNGNKYRAWAYVEAANFAMRYNAFAKKFYQRKLAEKNAIVATQALANKICRATYYMMRDHVPFDNDRLFRS